MRLIVSLFLAVLLGVSLESPRDVQAEVLGPGEYTGWVVQDRWGAVCLANGVYRLPFRGKARDAALAWKGKPVVVDVSEIAGDEAQYGIGAIKGIKAAEPVHAGRLTVQLERTEIRQPRPRRQELRLSVRYEGQEKFKFDCRRLMVVVQRVGRPTPAAKGQTWVVFPGKDARGTAWTTGGASMNVMEHGKRLRNEQVYKAPGGTFETTGTFTYSTKLLLELLEGEYELFAIYNGWNYSNFSGEPGPRSTQERFDVVVK